MAKRSPSHRAKPRSDTGRRQYTHLCARELICSAPCCARLARSATQRFRSCRPAVGTMPAFCGWSLIRVYLNILNRLAMRGSKYIHGSRAKRRGYPSQRNGTPSCWANFSRCLACMAISYQTLIWLRWLWNTGLPFTPRTEILRGFAIYVALIPSRPEDKGWRGRVPCCQTAPHARSDMFSITPSRHECHVRSTTRPAERGSILFAPIELGNSGHM